MTFLLPQVILPNVLKTNSEKGWTLQELIAPRRLTFFDHDWFSLGTKSELLTMLSNKTGIPESVLSDATRPTVWSVAQRMSWAAGRTTTRIEDRAYSLMGLFDVDMPLLYGELNAFLRLQQAIAGKTEDESIFAWDFDPADSTSTYSGLYAPSPSSFVGCRDFAEAPGSSGFTEANGKLSITLRTWPRGMETYRAVLNCTDQSPQRRIAILVARIENEQDFVRVKTSQDLSRISVEASKTRSLKQRLIRVPINPQAPPLNHVYGFWLRTLQPPGHAECNPVILSSGLSSETDRVCVSERGIGTAGIVHFQPKKGSSTSGWSKIRWLKLGFDEEFNPVILLCNGQVSYNSGHARLKPDQQSFQQVINAGAEGKNRDRILNNDWINASAGLPNKAHGWPSGVCILQISRKRGLNHYIHALNLGIAVQCQPDPFPSSATQEIKNKSGLPLGLGRRSIWTVDVTDNGGSSPESEHFCSDCGLWGSLGVGTMLTCFLLPCPLQEAQQEHANRNAIRGWSGRLGNVD